MYTDILRRLRDAVRSKRPDLENRQLVSVSQQCSSTPVGFGQGFLSEGQCDNNGASPILLAAAHFYLFPRLNSVLTGRRFWNATDIIKNATSELKRLLLNSFHLRLQRLYSVFLCMGTICKEICVKWLYCFFHHYHVQEGIGLIPVPCILKMKLVPPSLPRSSYVSSSFLVYIVVLV